ncbi:MAG: recombinase family protein [Gaiella sp.]|nr:recombinase family protein [Gaiella sp.]
MRVVGYIRVSTDEQASSGLGLAAQREAVEQEARRRGWTLVAVCEDRASGKSLRRRPGLDEAISLIEHGEAEALVTAKLDRLSRSVADFSALLARFSRAGWGLVIVDVNVDTSTPTGEAMAHVVASFAQMERRRIAERTREALAQARDRGTPLGRPRVLDDAIRGRVAELRAEGLTLRGIAERLDDDRVPTAHGGKRWHAETVRKLLAAG